MFFFFFSSRRRHTRWNCDWSSDVCSSDLADGAAGLQVDEGGGDFAPVAEFQCALAEAAVGDERDGVSHAAIDFDIRNEALALGDGIVNAKFAQAEHGQAHAEDLPGAQMAVSHGGQVNVFSKS